MKPVMDVPCSPWAEKFAHPWAIYGIMNSLRDDVLKTYT